MSDTPDPCPVCHGQKMRHIGSIFDAHVVDGQLTRSWIAPIMVTCSECGGEGTQRAANLLDLVDKRK